MVEHSPVCPNDPGHPATRPLVTITLSVDESDQSGLHLDLAVSDPAKGYDGADVMLALGVSAPMIAQACDKAWWLAGMRN
jgi:hypothetical protein